MRRVPYIIALSIVFLVICYPKSSHAPADGRELIALGVLTSGAFIAGMLGRPGFSLTFYSTIGGALIATSVVDIVRNELSHKPPPAAELAVYETVAMAILTTVLFCQAAARVVWGSRWSAWKPETRAGEAGPESSGRS